MAHYRDCPEGDELAVILKRLQPLMGGAAPRPGLMWLPDHLKGPVDRLSDGAIDQRIVWVMPYHFTGYMSDLNAYKRYLDSLFGVASTLTVALLLSDMYPICRAITKERQAVRIRALKKKVA
ncbi:hypothetical protein [Micromonospora sp. NPDC007220]|uniref:hypothetical protein n=1 Tax=Micromonospora sp. NPDC007220 TaxID=3154318 RepID=UPI00340F8D38